jgi:hypothetical protein
MRLTEIEVAVRIVECYADRASPLNDQELELYEEAIKTLVTYLTSGEMEVKPKHASG